MVLTRATFFLERDRLLSADAVVLKYLYVVLEPVGCLSNGAMPRSARMDRAGEGDLVVVVHDPLAVRRWHLGQIERALAYVGLIMRCGPRQGSPVGGITNTARSRCTPQRPPEHVPLGYRVEQVRGGSDVALPLPLDPRHDRCMVTCTPQDQGMRLDSSAVVARNWTVPAHGAEHDQSQPVPYAELAEGSNAHARRRPTRHARCRR